MTAKSKKVTKQKWYDAGIEYLLYSLVVIVPAVFSPVFYSAFSEPKLLALRLITAAIFVLWGLKVFVEESMSIRKSRLNILLLVYGAISVLTTIFSIAFYTSVCGAHGRFIGLITVLNLLLLPFLVWNFLKDRSEIIKLLKISLITSSLLAVYGILQYFGVWQEGFNWNQEPAERVFGTIGHGNHFGAYLGMHFVLGIFLIKDFEKLWAKVLIGAGLLVHIITIMLTASRGAVFAVVLALIVSGICIAVIKTKNHEFKFYKLITPAFVLIALLISTGVIFKDDIEKIPLIERTETTIESIGRGNIPDRVSWWLSAIEMIKNRPVLGYGLSTYRDVYNEYRRTDYVTVEEGDQETHITPEAAHNEYLNIAATQGIIGLAAFLVVVIFVLWKANKVLYSSGRDKKNYALMGVKAAILVYLFQIIISFGVVATLTLFYVFLGAALGLSENKITEYKHKISGLLKYVLTLVMLVFVIFLSVYAVRESLAEAYYKKALVQASNYNYQEAENTFGLMIGLRPYEYAYYQAAGDFALQSSQPVSAPETKLDMLEKAVLYYEKANKINPYHPSTFYNLGVARFQIYSLTGELSYYKKGAKDFDKSIGIAVNNPLYPYQVGKAYMSLISADAKMKAVDYFRQALKIRSPYRDIDSLLEKL